MFVYVNNVSYGFVLLLFTVSDENGEFEYGRPTVGIERISPTSGKRYYKPAVAMSCRPEVGMKFEYVQDAITFYKNYAKEGGFTVRKNTQITKRGVVTRKYLVCSKEGQRNFRQIDTAKDLKDNHNNEKPMRKRPSIRTGCQAHLRFRLNEKNKYEVCSFVEEHNHSLVDKQDYHLLSSARSLSFVKEQLIYSLSRINVGPVKAFNIMRTHYGGFEEVGATKVDVKNFKRDLNVFIGEFDAEMAVSRLMSKKDYLPDFSCEYFTSENGRLAGLFWADQDMKRNYKIFGDVMSFDSTFRSNKYVIYVIFYPLYFNMFLTTLIYYKFFFADTIWCLFLLLVLTIIIVM